MVLQQLTHLARQGYSGRITDVQGKRGFRTAYTSRIDSAVEFVQQPMALHA